MAAGDDQALPPRRFGWLDMFVSEDDDPRADGGWENSERAVLTGFLDDRRLTLTMKCDGLTAEQLARRSVPPSDLSLLGIVRHLTGVERYWFRNVMAGDDAPPLYRGPDGEDLDFEFGFEFGLEPEVPVGEGSALVAEAWDNWRAEVAFATELVAGTPDLATLGIGQPVPLREVLVHLIREYAQHMGHADLLRERIDGRVGQ